VKYFDFDRGGLPGYMKQIVPNKDQLNIVEVGVFRGDYTSTYYSQLYGSKIYLVDLWETSSHDGYISGIHPGDIEEGYLSVTNTYKDDPNVFVCKGFSNYWAGQFEDQYFDWIYLDADHSRQAVLNDLKIGTLN